MVLILETAPEGRTIRRKMECIPILSAGTGFHFLLNVYPGVRVYLVKMQNKE
jgi:hypothetical protein